MLSDPNDTSLSSIPLQFLVHSIQLSCNLPIIVGDLINSSTLYVQANVTFSTAIIAQTVLRQFEQVHSTNISSNSSLTNTVLTKTINNESMNFYLLLGFILDLDLSLYLLLSLLSCCCCFTQWYAQSFWYVNDIIFFEILMKYQVKNKQ
ncbi:unnamed protein product [Rotaria sp. Silwood1]|nr:unnamed protein product [Rotaria sp. Silwood1]CAF4932494.1 unnamed protein product [Rotaria sp. Silwood1]